MSLHTLCNRIVEHEKGYQLELVHKSLSKYCKIRLLAITTIFRVDFEATTRHIAKYSAHDDEKRPV